jgi:hypothetical protein
MSLVKDAQDTKSKSKSKSKLLYDWRSVSQYVLVSGTPLGPMTFLILPTRGDRSDRVENIFSLFRRAVITGIGRFLQSRCWVKADHLCGLVVRVPGYRSRGPRSIPGATRFSEKQWVRNGLHSASWVQLRSYMKEKAAAPVYYTEITAVGDPSRWPRGTLY